MKRLIFPALALLIALGATIHAFAGPPSPSSPSSPHTRDPRIIFSPAYAPGFDEGITCKGFGGFNTPEQVAFTVNGSPIGTLTTDAKGNCISDLVHLAPFNADETIEAIGQHSGFDVSLTIPHLTYTPSMLVTCFDRHVTYCNHVPSGDHVRVHLFHFVQGETATIALGGVQVAQFTYNVPDDFIDITVPANSPDGAMFTAIGSVGNVQVMDYLVIQNHGSNSSPSSPSSPSSH